MDREEPESRSGGVGLALPAWSVALLAVLGFSVALLVAPCSIARSLTSVFSSLHGFFRKLVHGWPTILQREHCAQSKVSLTSSITTNFESRGVLSR